MLTNDRQAYRRAFFIAWEKYQNKTQLDPVEKQLVEVILLHPEFQKWLNHPAHIETQEFSMEENPFLHMSLHIALREQLRMDRPTGIKLLYQRFINKFEHAHDAEHQMMKCLASLLWQGQQTGMTPSDEDYIRLLESTSR